jgi:heat shock protein HslJ
MVVHLMIVSVIFGCASGATSGPSDRSSDPQLILDRTWQWVSTVTPVEKITVADPERYTLYLQEDGRVQARFDCNRGGGAYTLSEGKLSFGPLVSTRMACPEDSLDARFTKDLQEVVSFFIEDGRLYLELPFDSGTMRFQKAP